MFHHSRCIIGSTVTACIFTSTVGKNRKKKYTITSIKTFLLQMALISMELQN